MAAMTTALTEFASNGNSRTSILSDHTVALPRLVIEKRRMAQGNQKISEFNFSVVYATTDPNSEVIPEKIAFTGTVRVPKDSDSTDIAAALAVFRDVIAGDEFGVSVSKFTWL